MSCWTKGLQTTHAGHATTGAPAQPGMPVAAPSKCPICGWFATRSGACVNPDCGQRAQALQTAGARVQPAPGPAFQRWSAQAASAFSPEARAYLQTVGLNAAVVTAALQSQEAQVWHYLPRCPTCGAWVSAKTGVCCNPRCAKGKLRAQVVPPRGWQWPPTQTSRLHLEQGLGKIGVGRPDAHAAWHARAAELGALPPAQQDLSAVLERLADIEVCVADGMAGGWLDPDDPAFDIDAQAALSTASRRTITSVPGFLWSIGAMRGDWQSIALHSREAKMDRYDPATLPAERARAQQEINSVLADVRHERGNTIDTLAFNCVATISDTLISGSIPALLPRDLPGPLAKAVRERLVNEYPALTYPNRGWPWPQGTQPAREAYLWLNKARLDPDQTLSPTQKVAATVAFKDAARDLGYEEVAMGRTEDVYAVLDNGWSPAEANSALRRASRAKADIEGALANDGPYAAGQALTAHTRSLSVNGHGFVVNGLKDTRKKEDARVWTGSITSLQPNNLEISAQRQVIAGAGATVLNFASDQAGRMWLEEVSQGRRAKPHLEGLFGDVAAHRIKTALVQEGLASAEDHIGLDSDFPDICWVRPPEGSSKAVRIVQQPDSSGSLTTSFEPDANVLDSPFW
jgi:hypothetical protein